MREGRKEGKIETVAERKEERREEGSPDSTMNHLDGRKIFCSIKDPKRNDGWEE